MHFNIHGVHIGGIFSYFKAPFQRDRKGTGPEEGWVSIKLTGKDLVVPYVEIGELLGSFFWWERDLDWLMCFFEIDINLLYKNG